MVFSSASGAMDDIANQSVGVEAKQETRALYQMAGRIANIGFWEWDEIADKCIFCSEELAKIHGVSVDEFLRRSSSNAADRGWMHPDDRERYEVAAKLFRTEGEGFEIGYRLLRADGRVADVCEVVAPIVDENGTVVRSFGFVKDVSDQIAAAAEITKVNELFRQTECLAKIGHWEWDEVMDKSVYCSDELARMCGVSVERYLETAVNFDGDATMVHADDRERYRYWEAEFMKRPVKSECEYRLYGGNGRVREVREVVVPIFDQNKQHVRSIGFVQDISDSKKAAERLRQAHDELELRVLKRTAKLQMLNDDLLESKSRLRNATRIAKLGYFKWDPAAGKGIFCDEELADILGVPVDKCMTETIESYMRRIHPDDTERASASYESSYKRGIPVDIEYRIVRPGGDIRHVHELSTPKTDRHGSVIQTFGTLQDITDRKTIRENFAIIEERLHELGANAREVLYALTPDWRRVIYVSEAYERIWGQSCQSVLDDPKLWLDSLHPDDRETIVAEIEQKISGDDVTPDFSDARIIGPDGEVRWLSTRVYPIHNDAGEVIRLAGVAEDITDRKAATDALQQAQKMDAVGQLTGGVAHDFNNLLAVILGNSRLLQGRLNDDDEPLLQDIVAAGIRGAELTNRLLAFSRLQPLQPVKTNVVELVADMGVLLRRTLGATISVEITSTSNEVRALVDPGLLENAILNLALNARDAMPGGGRLEIRVSDPNRKAPSLDRDLTVTVKDNGVGMEADVLNHALEPFFTTKISGEGSGLGLPMVYGFVKQSNGDFHIDSSPDQGTTVTICLPCTND